MIRMQKEILNQFSLHFLFKLDHTEFYFSGSDNQWEISFLQIGLIIFKKGLS